MIFRQHQETLSETRPELSSVLRDLSFHLSGFRHDPPDMIGHLADRNVRQSDLDHIAQVVHRNWSGIRRIFVGSFQSNHYFSIESFSKNKDDHKENWPAAKWLQNRFPELNDFVFFFHGPSKMPVRDTLIFPSILTPGER